MPLSLHFYCHMGGRRSYANRCVQSEVKRGVYHQAVGSLVLTPTYHAINMWQCADPFPYHIKHKDQGHQQVSHSKHIDQSAEGESNGRPSHRRETQCQVEQQVLQEFWLQACDIKIIRSKVHVQSTSVYATSKNCSQ